jgi:hypothetical protein
MFQPGRTDNARWRASIPTAMARLGTREARVLPVQKEWVVTTSGSSLASASLVRFDAFALLPGQEGVDWFLSSPARLSTWGASRKRMLGYGGLVPFVEKAIQWNRLNSNKAPEIFE